MKRFVSVWLAMALLTLPVAAQDVIPLLEGDQAPHAGLLVREKRFTQMVKADILRADIAGRLEIQERLTETLEAMYVGRLEEASVPLKWYQTPEFNRWFGFGAGVLVTSLAVYGASQLAK